MGVFEDQIAAVSVAFFFASAVISWVIESRNNRAMREKEYAELIRSAASTTVVKIERLKELSLRFYQDLQPLIVQAHTIIKAEPLDKQISGPPVHLFDGRLPLKEQPTQIPNIWWKEKAQPSLERGQIVRGKVNTDKAKSTATRRAVEEARRHLYEGVVQARAVATQRILDEQIEMAYRDLYRYDIGIHNLFARTVETMKYIDRRCYKDALIILQDDILLNSLYYGPDEVGDLLRDTIAMISLEAEDLMETVIVPLREEMMRLIGAKDHEIYKKSIGIHGISLSSAITSGGIDTSQGEDPREKALLMLVEAMNNICTKNYVDASTNIKDANNSYRSLIRQGSECIHKEDALLWSREGFDVRTSEYTNAETDAQICYELSMDLNEELMGAWAGMALAEKKNGFANKRSLFADKCGPIETRKGTWKKIKDEDDIANANMKKTILLKDKKSLMTEQDVKRCFIGNSQSPASNRQLLSQLISNLKKSLR